MIKHLCLNIIGVEISRYYYNISYGHTRLMYLNNKNDILYVVIEVISKLMVMNTCYFFIHIEPHDDKTFKPS